MSDDQLICLVVDDEASLRHSLVRVLEQSGYTCLQAGSGRDAVAMLEQAQPDVVISDLQMPEMGGVELLEIAQGRWPDVAFVVVTAVTEVEMAVSCLQHGAMDYITKPFQIGEVRARIRQALEKRRLLKENQRYQLHLAELVRQQASRIEELFLEGVQTLVEALEAKDAYTRGHSSRVSAYAGRTAQLLGLTEQDQQLIELGAELHDVGKIGVREGVLLKPGPLTVGEYRHLMQHTVIGAHILEPLLKNAPEALAIVRSHHERMDGQGFPDGLKGHTIPMSARVVTVCDAFDAMTSGRPYRPAMSASDALAEMSRQRGVQFDPDVVAAFIKAYPDPSRVPIATPKKVRRRIPGGIAGVGVPAPAP